MARVTLAPKARKSKLQAPAPKRDGNPLKTGSLAPQPAASLSIAEAIGTQVRNLRRKLDLTGAELADQAGLVGRHAFQDRERRGVGVDRQPRGAGARAQRAAHHVLCEL